MTVRSIALTCLLLLAAPATAKAGWGSGTVVGVRGEILTAAHVVHDCGAIQVVLPDGRRAAARIEALDPVGDLALLRASMTGGTPPRLREDLARGEIVHVHGFPAAAEGNPVVSTSRVARLAGPRGEQDAISLDGRITVGESGAGVFDAHGNLVGVAYSAAERRWHAVGAARISEFLLAHGVPVSAGTPTGNPSLTQISNYLRMTSVHVRCWSTDPAPPVPPQEARRR
jgi:S1-C subfamily serine protease